MKQSLFQKFIIGYILLGVLSFILLYASGSYFIEKYLEKYTCTTLYKAATGISEHEAIKKNLSTDNLDAIQNTLTALSTFQDTEIWIINNKNQIIVSSRREIPLHSPIEAENFDPASWGDSYYQLGDFYGFFTTPMLSIITPITYDMDIRGYIAIHYQMNHIYERRSNILEIMILLYFVIYIFLLLLIIYYRYLIHKPLSQIIEGAAEYAGGNLTYTIPIHRDDELGYLANTLNYMADRLNENEQDQRNFIANVSHDFRSPLTSIKGYVEAILDGTIPFEMQDRYLTIISNESSRLEKLTQSLLTLNQLDSYKKMLQKQNFDINEMIKTTAATFEGICRKRLIHLEILLDQKELYASANTGQIQQVIYNLLDNAIKFSEDESTIILETTERNEKIFVSVKDFGRGIPKEHLSKIWERFYKIDSSRGKDRHGSGLGLAIVKEIISNHGENINVISTEGVGTEFIFTLTKVH